MEFEPRSAVRQLRQKGLHGALLKLGREGVVVGGRKR